MAMFGYFQNGFEQAAEKSAPAVKPVAKRAAAAAQPAVRARKAAALRPAKTGLLQNLFGREKSKENPKSMKTCVVTANYSCDPNKVWLYLTKPTPEPLAQRCE